MFPFRFFLKFLPVLIAIPVYLLPGEWRKPGLLFAGTILFAGSMIFYSGALYFRPWRIGIKRIGPYLPLYPGFLLTLLFIIEPDPTPIRNPPSLLFQEFSGKEKPDYNRALIARGSVIRGVGKDGYLVDLQLERREKKVIVKQGFAGKKRRRSGRLVSRSNLRSGKGTGSGPVRSRYRATYLKNRSRSDFKIREKQSKNSPYAKRQKKIWKKRVWIREELDEKDRLPFDFYVRIYGSNFYEGCKLQLKLYGRAVPIPLGENGFDLYLKKRGATGRLNLSPKYHVLESACPPKPWNLAIRDSIKQLIVSTISDPVRSGIATGMVLGEAGSMDKGTRRLANHSGVIHLFAASGLHLGIFYGSIYFPLALVFGKKSPTSLITPLFLAAFPPILLGFPVTLVRAYLFLLIHAMQSLIHRPVNREEHLANTATGILLFSPQSFVSISSLMSFGAVAGILYFFPILFEILGGRKPGMVRRILASQLSITTGATLFLIPVLVISFHRYSFVSSLVNLMAVPLSGWILPLLYGGLGLQFAGLETSGSLLLFLADVGIRGLVVLIGMGGFSFASQEFFHWWSFPILVDGMLVLSLLYFQLVKGDRRRERHAKMGVLVCLILLGPAGPFLNNFKTEMEKGVAIFAQDGGVKQRERIPLPESGTNQGALP